MSDTEAGFGGGPSGGGADDELSLPRATVQKVVQDMLPRDVTVARETRELIVEACVEFIRLVSSEANDVCERESKKTMTPGHVLTALKELGFEGFTEGVKEVVDEHEVQQKDRVSKQSRMEKSGLSPEELLKQQELLFAASRARYQGGG